MAFTSKLKSLSPSGASVFLISDTDGTGKQAYYFVKVARKAQARFLKAAESPGSMNLADHGEVLYSAYGDYPPPHIQRWAREELGWEG